VTPPATALTPDRILEAAEDVLRRFGPAKANVVDVARALGVSHGSVYRHFPTKAALRDAVVQRWLTRVTTPLAEIVAEDGPATDRLWRWVELLSSIKRQKVLDDPEMFATYHQLALDSRDVTSEHIDAIAGQVAKIIADGVARGEFAAVDPAVAGRAVLHATARFHNPAQAAEWSDPNLDADLKAVWSLLLSGLAAGRVRAG
jgi:AcrR family transcriptional regulator